MRVQTPNTHFKLTNLKKGKNADSGASCCSIISLDELAGGISNDGAAHAAFSPATLPIAYISACGALIAHKIYRSFVSLDKTIQTEYNSLENSLKKNTSTLTTSNTFISNNDTQINTTKKTQKIPEKTQEIESETQRLVPIKQFYIRMKKEAKFQRRFAGLLSGASSACIFLSESVPLIAKLCAKSVPMLMTPIFMFPAMLGLTVTGIKHAYHSIKDLNKTNITIKKLPDNDNKLYFKKRYKPYFNKRRKLLRKNIASWGVFSIGAGLLTYKSLAMLLMTVGMSVPPVGLTIAALTLLGLGIAGTLYYNNKLTSYKHLPFSKGYYELNQLKDRNMDKAFMAQQEIIRTIKAERTKFFKKKQFQRLFLRSYNKLGTLLTFGLTFDDIKTSSSALFYTLLCPIRAITRHCGTSMNTCTEYVQNFLQGCTPLHTLYKATSKLSPLNKKNHKHSLLRNYLIDDEFLKKVIEQNNQLRINSNISKKAPLSSQPEKNKKTDIDKIVSLFKLSKSNSTESDLRPNWKNITEQFYNLEILNLIIKNIILELPFSKGFAALEETDKSNIIELYNVAKPLGTCCKLYLDDDDCERIFGALKKIHTERTDSNMQKWINIRVNRTVLFEYYKAVREQQTVNALISQERILATNESQVKTA